MTKIILNGIPTQQLMTEILRRDDIILIGNWFYLEHIDEICKENNDLQHLTEDDYKQFMQENSVLLESEYAEEIASAVLKDRLRDFVKDNRNEIYKKYNINKDDTRNEIHKKLGMPMETDDSIDSLTGLKASIESNNEILKELADK